MINVIMDEVLNKIKNICFDNIKIKGLYERFDYEIPLKVIEDLAIFYGLNGIGKTTILKLINLFSHSIFEKVFEINFTQIDFKLISHPTSDFYFEFFISLFNSKSKKILFSFKSEGFNLEHEYTDINELGVMFRMIREIRVPEIILYENIEEESEISCQEPHDFFGSLLSNVNCLYIESLRNNIMDLNILDKFYKKKIKEYKKAKKEKRKAKKEKRKADKYVRKFKVGPLSSLEILNDLMDYFFEAKLNYVSNGIAYLYFHNITDNFKHEIQLYKEILNSLLDFKEILINENGLKCILENNEELPLKDLSSGEKNLLIMFYEILFDAHDYSLILVDEPEISLNINWHYDFIEILKDIRNLKHFQFIIATHSPQIVNENITNCIDMKQKDIQ